MVQRISQQSSIKDIPYEEAAQEAGRLRDELVSLYKEGSAGSEQFIVAQEKIWKLLELGSGHAGGVKASGAKSASELRSWIFNSWEFMGRRAALETEFFA